MKTTQPISRMELLTTLLKVHAQLDAQAPALPVGYVMEYGRASVSILRRVEGQTFDTEWYLPNGRRENKLVRVAADGSWRCGYTLLPLNDQGETFQ